MKDNLSITGNMTEETENKTEENEEYPSNIVEGYVLVKKTLSFGTMFGETGGEQIIGIFYTREAAEFAKKQVQDTALKEMNITVNPEIRPIYLELPPKMEENE